MSPEVCSGISDAVETLRAMLPDDQPLSTDQYVVYRVAEKLRALLPTDSEAQAS